MKNSKAANELFRLVSCLDEALQMLMEISAQCLYGGEKYPELTLTEIPEARKKASKALMDAYDHIQETHNILSNKFALLFNVDL